MNEEPLLDHTLFSRTESTRYRRCTEFFPKNKTRSKIAVSLAVCLNINKRSNKTSPVSKRVIKI